MIKFFHATLLTFLVTTFLSSCTSKETQPSAERLAECGVDADEHSRLMALSINAFDQDFKGGWRTIAYNEGCEEVAAVLLEDYISVHNLSPDDGLIFWHAGQTHAGAGNYPRAAKFFRQTFDDALQPGEPHYDWTLYGRGTLAFIERDRTALEKAIAEYQIIPIDEERVAAMKRFAKENDTTFPEEATRKPLNLVALEGLLRCFDTPYAQAYGDCETSDPS